MSGEEDTQKLAARIPWQSGKETGYVTIDAEIKGPKPVAIAIAREVREWLKQTYGADARILKREPTSGEKTQ